MLFILTGVALFMGLGAYYVARLVADLPGASQDISGIPFGVIALDQESQAYLVYVSLSGRYASYDAIMALAKQGGFIANECGSFDGYGFWGFSTESPCLPPIEENIKKMIINQLENYVSMGPYAIPDNYELLLSDEGVSMLIIGTALQPTLFSQQLEENGSIVLSKRANFRHTVAYRLKDYDFIERNARELVAVCSNIVLLNECILQEINTFTAGNLQWQVSSVDATRGLAAFTVTSPTTLPTKTGPVTYRLALSFR